MTFSNPAGAAAAAAASAYTRALLGVLGTQDPIEVLAETMGWLQDRTAELDEMTLRRSEAPGKWSVIEVIQHLADSDLVFGFRLRMILTEDQPPLQGYDQDAWARTFQYREVELHTALAQLHGLRVANIHLLKKLSPPQLQRVGRHSERGPESAGFLLRLMAGHDLVHRRQIDRILAAGRTSG
ncbi:MAG TPA: DinB family protein [Gemmatimonadales bacterium]|nr:DinB family protein [Gemmatimonadales bacterium]